MNHQIVLTDDTDTIKYLRKKDKRLSKVITMIGPLTYSVHSDGYAFLVHEIIEQMLKIQVAAKIYERLQLLCKGDINPLSIRALTDVQIKSTGTSLSKVTYLRCLTEAVLCGTLDLSELERLPDDEVIAKLTAIRGIGLWTAKMYLIFVLNRQDVLPCEDMAFIQSFMWLYKTADTSKTNIEKKCKKWQPYSSIGARYLYRALDMGLTKQPFHLYI